MHIASPANPMALENGGGETLPVTDKTGANG
jgi:hypothetical protein